MEWTHTSANLQHAKTTARREQSRESDAPEKHWGLGENGGDAVARRPSPPLAGHCTSHPRNIHHEAHARPRCRRGHRARARASEAAGLTRSPPPPRLPRSACHQPRGRSKGSAQRIGAWREGRERWRAHHSSTHSCGETSIPSGAPLPSTGRNHGDPPAPGGSALALSIR